MGRRFRGPVRPPKIEGPRTNERINVPSVRVISDTGEQLGILDTAEAIDLARQRGLDLVEVAGQEIPPVCRFIDYGRFKYDDKKRKGKAKKNQKTVEIKEIKIRPKTDSHDIDFKFKNARKFLEEGNKVKVTVRFRGREIMYAEEEATKLVELAERISDIGEIETPPVREGRTISMMLAPDKRKMQALADRKRNRELAQLKLASENSSETPEQDSSEAPEQDSGEAPEQDSSEAPEQDSSEAPEQDSGETPEQDSSEAPEQDSSEAPEQIAPEEAVQETTTE